MSVFEKYAFADSQLERFQLTPVCVYFTSVYVRCCQRYLNLQQYQYARMCSKAHGQIGVPSSFGLVQIQF